LWGDPKTINKHQGGLKRGDFKKTTFSKKEGRNTDNHKKKKRENPHRGEKFKKKHTAP